MLRELEEPTTQPRRGVPRNVQPVVPVWKLQAPTPIGVRVLTLCQSIDILASDLTEQALVKNRGLDQLGRRERQIMEIVYRRGRATAADVLADLPDPPTYTAVRGMLRLLESKGQLRHEHDGPRYVYFPTADPDRVSKSAVRHLVRTFFDNSASSAVAAMVGMYEDRWSDADLDQLERLIDKARAKSGDGKGSAS